MVTMTDSTKVKTPELILYKEWRKYPPKMRERYNVEKIKEFVGLNKEKGITVNAIEGNSYFDRHLISHVLKMLLAKGEVYSHNIDSKTTMYFPNGNVVDSIGETNVEIGGKFYSVYKLKNQFGHYIYIQEKRRTPLESFEVSGGLIIPTESKQGFLRFLEESFKNEHGDK